MNNLVTVHQIGTGNGAFMNVDANNIGHIKVEFCVWEMPTYFMKPKQGDRSIARGIVQFDTPEFAAEYIGEHGDVWDFIKLNQETELRHEP